MSKTNCGVMVGTDIDNLAALFCIGDKLFIDALIVYLLLVFLFPSLNVDTVFDLEPVGNLQYTLITASRGRI